LPLRISFPEILSWEKRLERMGVATAELDKVRAALADDFVSTALAYLSRPEFPERLLRTKLAGKLRGFSHSLVGD